MLRFHKDINFYLPLYIPAEEDVIHKFRALASEKTLDFVHIEEAFVFKLFILLILFDLFRAEL